MKKYCSKLQVPNLVKLRQKFAPYSKIERAKRQKEVYRLHFEEGLSATKIAEAMKVNRNTINDDLQTSLSIQMIRKDPHPRPPFLSSYGELSSVTRLSINPLSSGSLIGINGSSVASLR